MNQSLMIILMVFCTPAFAEWTLAAQFPDQDYRYPIAEDLKLSVFRSLSDCESTGIELARIYKKNHKKWESIDCWETDANAEPVNGADGYGTVFTHTPPWVRQ